MKIRTTKYVIKDGVLNTYRNKLMSFASIIIITASILVFGIFLLISINISSQTDKALEKQSVIEVFCDANLDDKQIQDLEVELRKNTNVLNMKKVTREEAFNRLKEILGENKKALEGYDGSFLPVSFIVKIKDPNQMKSVVDSFETIKGVEYIGFLEKDVAFLTSVARWARIICLILIIILLSVSVFIISNTIKITVFARRREISIMKYIGATDWFIRLPFAVEGIIIGFVGASISFVITYLLYGVMDNQFNKGVFGDGFRLVDINSVIYYVIASYCCIGMVVGGIGSAISIRKYLHV